MDGKTKTLAARFALAGAAVLALAGTMDAGHAETAVDLPPAHLPANTDTLGARFTPSAQAQLEAGFEQQFAPFAGDLTAPALPDHAVDVTTITPAASEARALGSGVASYYGRRFAGRATASGENFDPQQLTAAHRTLPFGSQVRVINPRNGKSVVVRINDRGPYTRGRTIDLSRRAADAIGIVAKGHGSVELELLAG